MTTKTRLQALERALLPPQDNHTAVLVFWQNWNNPDQYSSNGMQGDQWLTRAECEALPAKKRIYIAWVDDWKGDNSGHESEF